MDFLDEIHIVKCLLATLGKYLRQLNNAILMAVYVVCMNLIF